MFGGRKSLVSVISSPLVLIRDVPILMADILRVLVVLFLLLLELAGLVAGSMNGLRSVRGVTVTSRPGEEIPTLRVVLGKLRLGLRLGLRLASVVVSRVGGGEEIGVSEVRLVGHIVHVHSSL